MSSDSSGEVELSRVPSLDQRFVVFILQQTLRLVKF